jgi:rhodanese-related sulfurtransferase
LTIIAACGDLVHAYFRAKHAAYASPMTVKAWLDTGTMDFVIVDVRNPSPQLKTGIPGAVRLPGRDIARRFNELPKDKLLVLLCWDTWCSLATSAALVLLDKGYRVKELSGGIKAWQTLHMPEVEFAAPAGG